MSDHRKDGHKNKVEHKATSSEHNSHTAPPPVKLPPPTEPHPSEAQAVTYHDPAAPKAKRKVKRWVALAGALLVLGLLAGGAAFYWFDVKNGDKASVIDDYSGGIAEGAPADSVVAAETEAAKEFVQAVQAKDAAMVEQLATETLKQHIRLVTKNQEATVLSYYQGQFDGVDFDTLISSMKDGKDELGVSGKMVVFSDQARTEGATGVYNVEVLVVNESGQLRVNSVKINLSL